MSPRVYVRKLDWADARRRHAAGESYAEIARDYGVSAQAVHYACNDEARERMVVRRAAWGRSGKCIDCGEPCSRRQVGDELRCMACAGVMRRTSVREDTLQCQTCQQWFADDEFARSRDEPARRGRHAQCRSCSTKARRDYRARHRERDREVQRAWKRRKYYRSLSPERKAISTLPARIARDEGRTLEDVLQELNS